MVRDESHKPKRDRSREDPLELTGNMHGEENFNLNGGIISDDVLELFFVTTFWCYRF